MVELDTSKGSKSPPKEVEGDGVIWLPMGTMIASGDEVGSLADDEGMEGRMMVGAESKEDAEEEAVASAAMVMVASSCWTGVSRTSAGPSMGEARKEAARRAAERKLNIFGLDWF